MAIIMCSTANIAVGNSYKCCAERRLVGILMERARREGVHPYRFVQWFHRKQGVLVIKRMRRDGLPGVSLPCVCCRKVLDRMGLKWRAHVGNEWFSQDDAPPSKPTNKQRSIWAG